MATERGWAIAYDGGIYVGWHYGRRAAIAQHVSDLWSHRDGFGDISPYAFSAKLNDDQRRAWALCKKKGDRAVKVKITY
jgi:hypothetical protein